MFLRYLCLVALLAPMTLHADTDLQNRIDVAGRQRMLSQRMVRASCHIQLGNAAEHNSDILNASKQLFATSLAALKSGGGPEDFVPESDPQALTILADVEEAWTRFSGDLDRLHHVQTASFDELAALSEDSMVLLQRSNALVEHLDTRYKAIADESNPALGRMINIAGRQRMLIQKAGKEACLAQMAQNPEDVSAYLAQLQDTVALFEKSAFGLAFSSDELNLPVPPSHDIEMANFDHWQNWVNVEVLFNSLADRKLHEEELAELSRAVEFFLTSLNATVGLYARM